MEDAPPFFRDTKLDVNQRTYYLNAGNFTARGTRPWPSKGPWLRFRYGHVAQYQGTRSVTDQLRIIINYDFSLL